jgi:hypothetical protein
MSLVQGLRRRANQVIDTGLSYLPPDTVAHLANASTELLRAARALADEQIAWNGRHVARADEIRRRRQGSAAPAADRLSTDGPSRPD